MSCADWQAVNGKTLFDSVNWQALQTCTVGIHGNTRLGGNTCPDIMIFGRIVGVNAAGASM